MGLSLGSGGVRGDPRTVERLRRAMERAGRARDEASDAGAGSSSADLVSQLERLAALRATGALSDSEYEWAERALIGNPGTSS